MKKVGVFGGCVLAALASGALVASGAGAATFETCQFVGKGGNFTESSCATVARKKGAADHKGKWELEPVGACAAMKKGAFSNPACETRRTKRGGSGYGIVPSVAYTGTLNITKITLGSVTEGGYIECTGGSSAGTITAGKAASERLTLTGCKLGRLACQSVGSSGTPSGASEEIVTNELAARLIGHGEQTNGPSHAEPAAGAAWLEYSSAEHQPYVTEIECGAAALLLRISGSLTGASTPTGAMTASVKTFFEQPVIEEALVTEVSDGVGFAGETKSNIEAELVEHLSSPVEIVLSS